MSVLDWNGGIVGADNTPNVTTAPGIWSIERQMDAKKANIFPPNGPLTQSLVAYWSLDSLPGNQPDLTGRGNNLSNGATYLCSVYTGKITGAQSTNTSNTGTYLKVNNNTDTELSGSDFSVSAWVYLTAKTSPYGNWLICKTDAGSIGYQVLFHTYNNTVNKMAFMVFKTGTSYIVYHNATINLNTWYHVVATFNNTSKQMNLYVDSVAATPVTITGSMGSATSRPTEIGNYSPVAGTVHSGLICEVGIWKRELSSTEVAQLYNSGNGLPYAQF